MAQTVPSLSQFAVDALPLNMNAIVVDENGVLTLTDPPRSSTHRFRVDGQVFHVVVQAESASTLFQIWTRAGYVPYTAEAPEQRRTAMQVLRQMRRQSPVRFVVGDSQEVMAVGEERIDGPVTPDGLLFVSITFLHQTRPFLRLLANFLRPAETGDTDDTEKAHSPGPALTE